MTETDWQASTDPDRMLEFLRARTSARKLRLFAVACSRRVWPRIDDLGRAAVELAECYADGLADDEALRAARLACRTGGASASWYAAASDPFKAAGNAARSALAGAPHALAVERAAQAELLREVIGTPFHPARIDPAWRTARVLALARTIYDDRAFERLPALAEMLEVPGCDDAPMLAHCRAPGEHVRGCWVVDLLLDRP